MLTITDRAAVETVFAAFGADLSRTVAHHINLAVLENDCCKASFLRGAFLAGGSVTDPSKNYHLELITAHASVSRETAALLTELGFAARSIDRGANTVLYFKKSEAIEDFLTKIGAPCAAMDIMSAKVEKSMNNTINRKVNCDTANADKVVAAAQEQIDAIRRIERDYGLDVLPEKLRFYCTMVNLLTASLLSLVYTNDVFTGYVFIEISTIAACALVMAKDNGPNLVATIRYLFMSLLGSGLYLIGLTLLNSITGYLLMPSLSEEIAELTASGAYHTPLLISVGLIVGGLGIKSAKSSLQIVSHSAQSLEIAALSILSFISASRSRAVPVRAKRSSSEKNSSKAPPCIAASVRA